MNGGIVQATLIFDKSFIEMLNLDELFELSVFFDLVSTPILRKEILANLQKKSTEERNALFVMKSLCSKMSRSGIEPMEYWSALYELDSGRAIPMHGALLIDASAPNVRIGRGGGIHIDGRELQWDWRRWAEGIFTEEELTLAADHRRMVDDYDPDALCKQWRPKGAQWFGDCKSIKQITAKIDSLIDDAALPAQELILSLTTGWLCATDGFKQHLLNLLRSGRMGQVKDYAPFATSVVRLSLVYQFSLVRGFIGPRRSDICDLEYLYYVPFCRFFVSGDRLHRALWEATTTKAMFCNGAEVKADLKLRAQLRKEAPDKVAGPEPIPLENSVLSKMFEHLHSLRRRPSPRPAAGSISSKPPIE